MSELTGLRKAAILLVTLGADISAEIMKQLTEQEIEDLTLEIAKIRELPSDAVSDVIEEFAQLAGASSYVLQGGRSYAREVLHKAVGPGRADEILDRLRITFRPQPFAALRKADPRHVADFLRREHPQTVALILANLDSAAAAQILANLPSALRIDVVQRLAQMDTTSPEVLRQIDQVLERRLAALFRSEVAVPGGARAVADILNSIDRVTEKQIFEALEPANPALAEEVRRLMFTFDDLTKLDDRSMQRLLKDVDQKELALALKAAGEPVMQKISSNLSERARTMLRQEIEYLGPVKLRDVEDAQGRIVRLVRSLEDAGEVMLAGSDGGDVLV
jgi:flagellar motor switch protein FliG